MAPKPGGAPGETPAPAETPSPTPAPKEGKPPERTGIQQALKNLSAQSLSPADEDHTKSPTYKGEVFADREARNKKAIDEIKHLDKVEDIIGKIETVEDLQKLSVDQLIKLEDKYEGILLYAFTDIVGEKTKLDFAKWEIYKKPTPGMRLVVDFHGNQSAEMKLGAADILPPSVRKITVYTNGDSTLARTSSQRCGLKGRNREGTGFFDNRGYIPIFTNDVIVIGGEEKPEQGVNLKFADKFLTKDKDGNPNPLNEDSYKAYEASDEAKQDKEFLEKLQKSPSFIQRGKRMTPEEIDALNQRLEGSGLGNKVAKLAVEAGTKHSYSPEHCFDWANHIYKSAGASRQRIYSSLSEYSGQDCGDHHAGPELLDKIRPGDWLFYNNQNGVDSHGNHSAIFLEWIDKDNQIARMASGSKGNFGHIHPADFKKAPVTLIMKPYS